MRGKVLYENINMLSAKFDALAARVRALEALHGEGAAHRAGDAHTFGAVPDCVCGCSLDAHARDPQRRAIVLHCEHCGAATCARFCSAQLGYLEAT